MDPNLLLKREEITIFAETGFILPIHPTLLRQSLDPRLASRVLEQTAEDWFADMQEQIQLQSEEDQERWRRFYFKTPRVLKRIGDSARLEPRIFSEISYLTKDNGFAYALCMERNFEGSIYFNPEPNYLSFGRQSQIPIEKLEFYAHRKIDENFFAVFYYSHHNVEQLPSCLFLRAWGVNYLNAALSSIM
jgi:hypothetical protein